MVGLLRFLLERQGYKVLVATDGRQALSMINEMPPPALVILDVMLPYVRGGQLLAQIRAKAEWRAVPVIMLTGDSTEGSIVRALDAGADDYVIKPFSFEELLARVRRSLNSRA
ncbi:MAG: response regulator [Deltaproteobacteria bacterium]|nr:response regulator [Deltaproteobacteria bacterium]